MKHQRHDDNTTGNNVLFLPFQERMEQMKQEEDIQEREEQQQMLEQRQVMACIQLYSE